LLNIRCFSRCPSNPSLDGFTGILQVDGYGGYRVLADKSGVTLAFCWAHVRRRFYELAAAGPAPIAREALRRIAELYKIEDVIRGRSADERLAARHAGKASRASSKTSASRSTATWSSAPSVPSRLTHQEWSQVRLPRCARDLKKIVVSRAP
jgi:hypothetical protein